MTTLNAIKKAEKITGQKSQSTNPYSYNYKGFVIEFYKNGHGPENEVEAVCFYTRRENEKDDIMTDYFAGIFHDNLSQAIKFIDSININ